MGGCKLNLRKRMIERMNVFNINAQRVEDTVASLFARGFWEAVCRGQSYEEGFDSGMLRVETELEESFLDEGQHYIAAKVPKYKLGVDPDDPSKVS
jgi:hypothetical protein